MAEQTNVIHCHQQQEFMRWGKGDGAECQNRDLHTIKLSEIPSS